MKFVNSYVELFRITPDALDIIEKAGRVCYASTADKLKQVAFVKGLIKSGHHTPLEHCTATFGIETSIGVSRELMRHRLASPNEQSTRYVNFDNIEFIDPIEAFPDLTVNDRLVIGNAYGSAERTYNLLRKNNVSKDIARNVLPLGMKTRILWSANFRELIHVLNLRYHGTTGKPHPEMKIIAGKMYEILNKEYPDIFFKG